jgi:two-component system response regulator DesR
MHASSLKRLLIADDDPAVRSLLAASLHARFTVVGAARDGAEAVALAQATRPDAAIVDVDMPAGGARRAVPGILAAAPATAVVVLSADESDEVVRELIEAGAVTYCRKGTPIHALADAVDRSIAARAFETALG